MKCEKMYHIIMADIVGSGKTEDARGLSSAKMFR